MLCWIVRPEKLLLVITTLFVYLSHRWSTDPSAAFGAAAAASGLASQFGSLAGLPAGLFYPSSNHAAYQPGNATPGAATGVPSPRVSPTSPLAPLSPISSLSPITQLALLPPSIPSLSSMSSLTSMTSMASSLAPILLPTHATHYAAPAGTYSAAAIQAQQAQALRLMPQHNGNHGGHQHDGQRPHHSGPSLAAYGGHAATDTAS